MKTKFLNTLIAALALLAIGCGGAAEGETAEPQYTRKMVGHGKVLYESTCASCHGVTGQGDGPNAAGLNPKPRNFGDAGYMAKLTDEEVAATIKMGGSMKGMPQMPSHPQFDEEELQALVAYVRSLSQK